MRTPADGPPAEIDDEPATLDSPTRLPQRHIDLAGRDRVILGRLAAAGGDAGAARAFLAGAAGSEDATVAGEAANALASVDAMDAGMLPRLRRRRQRPPEHA